VLTNHQPARVTRLWAGMAALLVASAALSISAPAAGASGSNAMTVTAGEYAYQLKGKLNAGWVQINFVNAGTETHMMSLIHLKPGVTAAQVKTAVLSQDQNAAAPLVVDSGNVAPTPGLLGPGMTSGIITKLAAGHYVMLCFLAASDGQPHVAHGMIKTFDVAKTKSSLTPPKDGVVNVGVSDTAVTLPANGLPAKGYAKFTNSGTTNRGLETAKLQPGVTIAQADAYFGTLFSSGPTTGTPPAVLSGGFEGLPQGGIVYMVLDFPKGSFGYSSQNSDLDNDPSPVEGTFTIK
jgi:hypothetical protein